MTPVDWSTAALGGAMIGAAAALFFRINGRIAGVSGIFGDIFLDRNSGNSAWRIAFIVGLILGCVLVRAARPELGHFTPQTSWLGMALAGLLVGFGTRMGCGCTSGHGICGISRISPRSIAATSVFMAVAIVTSGVLGHFGLLR